MTAVRESMKTLAAKIYQLLKSDRDVAIGVAGFTGEGKSTFTGKLAKEYSLVADTYWGFDRMTWVRKEMMTWIDGEGKNKEGRLPEYSIIVPDELFTMFYRRQWYENEQIDAISTFNMCRDRHLFIIGNVPNFWDLDGAFTNRIRFYIYIPFRGVAWVFEQENNPFTSDPWNVAENRKMFRKNKNPYSCPNFLCEVLYDDWTEEEKEEYYRVRNEKRVEALQQSKQERVEKYRNVKEQRDCLIRWIYEKLHYESDGEWKKPTQAGIAEVADVSKELVAAVCNGDR